MAVGSRLRKKHDLEKAKASVKELGLEGKEIVMRTSSGRYPNDRETALAIGAQLQKAGLNIKVRRRSGAHSSKT
jgi:ABC-type transport system substrate-binding protein